MTWDVTAGRDEIGLLMEAGLIYRDAKQFEEARQVFRGVQALLPKSDVVEVALGTVSFQAGEFDDAARHYARALELNPRSAYANAHFGELELFRLNKDAARSRLKQAVELDPRGMAGKLARSLSDRPMWFNSKKQRRLLWRSNRPDRKIINRLRPTPARSARRPGCRTPAGAAMWHPPERRLLPRVTAQFPQVGSSGPGKGGEDALVLCE